MAKKLQLVVALCLSAIVAWSVLGHGLPALRHDWRIPDNALALGETFISYAEGWLSNGIGSPQPYPTFYLLALPLWVIHWFLSPLLVIALFITVTSVVASLGSARLAAGLGGNTMAQIAVSIFAVLNPWVYSEYVAGHIFMVLGYAFMIALLAEICSEHPRRYAIVLLSALSITQIEFFFIIFIPLLVWSLKTHRIYASISAVVAFVPIGFGLATNWGALNQIPYNLPWQEAQSVPLRDGLLMLGYSFNYASNFSIIRAALVGLCFFALLGMIWPLRSLFTWIAGIFGLACAVYASGTTSVFSTLYRWIVLHIQASGIYRELYDLIAILAVTYIILLTSSLTRLGKIGWIGVVLAASLTIPWLQNPAFTWFISADSLPSINFTERPHYRVALLPGFQPLSFAGKGSGIDPDAYFRPSSAPPINEAYPMFPVDRALALSEYYGDPSQLSALSVARVIDRPYLSSDWHVLQYQQIISPESIAHRIMVQPRNPIPILSISNREPTVVSVGNDLRGNGLFFGDTDTAAAPPLRALQPSRLTIDPRIDWIDARLASWSAPQFSNAFGGIVTSSSQALHLPVCNECNAVLAFTTNTLLTDQHFIIAHAAPTIAWHALPVSAKSLWCRGVCFVALVAKLPPHIPTQGPEVTYHSIDYRMIRPWMLIARIPTAKAGTLRLNIRYDYGWIAIFRGHLLPHIRLDTSINAWRLRNVSTGNVYFIQIKAAAQLLLEVLAIVALCLLTRPKRYTIV